MEKVETKIIETEEITHHFYCDKCGDHLGSSEEWDDGYYQEFGEFELKCNTPRGWYKLEKCLCHSCADEFLETFYSTLESIGFELD
jgi:formylmethanofuran dehydrogenase subunit E